MKYTIYIFVIAILFGGCASTQEQEYNKPAVYWYNKMIKQITTYQMDEADDTYTSLESEHRNSPLIPSALLIIANAHMEDEEYIMANYYFDLYLKRYSIKKNADYIRFLKIKSKFLSFENQYRDQQLLDTTLKDIDKFVKEYPNSEYIYLVYGIQSKLRMTQTLFDDAIARLYHRIDKPKAQKFYEQKTKNNWKDIKHIQDIKVPWYRAIFE
jgi:outer membrane protein assembly factor BamD